jgi:hypothetical protein
MSKLYQFSIAAILSIFLVACGGGGGSSDDDDVEFPTPALPAGATKIDATNAEDIANSALGFVVSLPGFAARTEAPPSIPQVIRQITLQSLQRSPDSGFEIAGKTEDLSAIFCLTGTAVDTYDEKSSSVSGEIRFTSCDIGFGIILNGTFPYQGSWNDATLDYNFQFGGTLTFDDGVDRVTVVLNFVESGNENTCSYSLSPSFSLAGVPEESYLVTTAQALTGNYFTSEVGSGALIVHGADNTRLCLTVTAINTVTVELDDGLGAGCQPLALVITL